MDNARRELDAKIFRALDALDRKYDTFLSRMEHKLDQLIQLGVKEMAALQDLQNALTQLTTSVGRATDEITALLGKITAPGTSDADVENAVAQIQSIVNNLDNAVAVAKQKAP